MSEPVTRTEPAARAEAAPDLSRLRIERAAPQGAGRAGSAGARGGGGGGGRTLLIVIVIVLLGVIVWLAWPRLAALRDGRAQVTVGRVLRTGGAASVSGTAANGYVVARRQAALSTDMQGRLVELRVEEGSRVKSGDLVARLDTRELEASLERSRGDLGTARATLELAELAFKRTEPLLKTGDVSQADMDAARANRDEAAATVTALEAAVKETEVRISKSSVYAPFDGVVTAKNAEVGEVVSSIASSGNSRGSVATLVDFDTLEVQVELAQTSLRAARQGAPVIIYLDAFPDRAYKGRVRQIWPTADRQKATVELRAEFLERDDLILPEMGVRVVFTADDVAAPADVQVRVPARAVVRSGAETAVFVVSNGKAARRVVTLAGEPVDGAFLVTAGLAGGESVVLDPPPDLADGAEVRLPEPASQ
jgi:RND family efflux transporter MFP subunit